MKMISITLGKKQNGSIAEDGGKPIYPILYLNGIENDPGFPSGEFKFLGNGRVLRKSEQEEDDDTKTYSYEIEVMEIKPSVGNGSKQEEPEPEEIGGLDSALTAIEESKMAEYKEEEEE